MRDPHPHVQVIREAVDAIAAYRPADRDTFFASSTVQDAILMRLQVIGEALARLRRLDAERFAAKADDSWWQIIGSRNVISHGYEVVDREMIWHMVDDELAAFVASLQRLEES